MHSLIFYASAWATLSHVAAAGYVKVNYNKEYVSRSLSKREIPVNDLDENITLAIQGSVSCGSLVQNIANPYSRFTGLI